MFKKIAILLVAALWTLGIQPVSSAAQPPTRSRTSATRTSRGRALIVRNASARRVRRHRRRVTRWSPWHVGSFGNPADGDDPSGEDPVVREVALQALGRWNGSVVVVDPNSGRVLSIVNQKLALSGAFTPCSTFKPVVALAALKEGIISPETKLRVFGRNRMNVTDALAHSNNMFFAKLGEMLGFHRVSEYAHEFGLGERAGLNIADESAGRFPPEPPKVGGVGLLTSFGQDIEITSLQLASIVSAIANGGTLYYLQYPRTSEEVARFEPRVRRQLDDLEDYFPDVKQGMAAAVMYGTARSAFDPDEQILGKTGTCSEDGARLGWFASYSSSSDSEHKYVVVVLLRGGRMMFGPHAAEIAGKVFHDLHDLQKTLAQRSVPRDATGSLQQ